MAPLKNSDSIQSPFDDPSVSYAGLVLPVTLPGQHLGLCEFVASHVELRDIPWGERRRYNSYSSTAHSKVCITVTLGPPNRIKSRTFHIRFAVVA